MKFYIAARFDKAQEVKKMQQVVIQKGHEICGDWTKHKKIKPYNENQKITKQYAIEGMEGVKNCDIFILITDEAGTGMYVELGAAILSHTLRGKPKIYVIGKHLSRSMFYFHPSVKTRKNINEVLKEVENL